MPKIDKPPAFKGKKKKRHKDRRPINCICNQKGNIIMMLWRLIR